MLRPQPLALLRGGAEREREITSESVAVGEKLWKSCGVKKTLKVFPFADNHGACGLERFSAHSADPCSSCGLEVLCTLTAQTCSAHGCSTGYCSTESPKTDSTLKTQVNEQRGRRLLSNIYGFQV